MAKQACLIHLTLSSLWEDGTVNEVVNGIVESEITSVTLGILLTVLDDFVRGTNLVLNHDSFIDAVLTNETQSVDVGKIETSLE
jgi:diacylglycerol kinase family enzyme